MRYDSCRSHKYVDSKIEKQNYSVHRASPGEMASPRDLSKPREPHTVEMHLPLTGLVLYRPFWWKTQHFYVLFALIGEAYEC